MIVFFVCYGGGHVAIIEPLLEYIVKNKPELSFKVLALTTAYPRLQEKYPCNVLKISDYFHIFDIELQEQILQYGTLLLADNYTPGGVVTETDSVVYLGLSMSELVSRHGEKQALELYKEKRRQAFLPIETMKKILNYELPDFVCTTNAPRFEKAAILASNELKIKNLQINDLFEDDFNPSSKNQVVINEETASKIRKRGFSHLNIYALGQPAIERTVHRVKAVNTRSTKTKINIDNDKKTIGFFTQHHNFESVEAEDKYFNNLESLFFLINDMEFNIIVRIHPNQNINEYERLKSSNISFNVVNNYLNLYETIAISDFVLTNYSTVGLEAMCCGKLVYTFNHNHNIKYPIAGFKRKPFIYSENFTSLIDNLRNSKYVTFESDNLLNITNSAEQIINLIVKLNYK